MKFLTTPILIAILLIPVSIIDALTIKTIALNSGQYAERSLFQSVISYPTKTYPLLSNLARLTLCLRKDKQVILNPRLTFSESLLLKNRKVEITLKQEL